MILAWQRQLLKAGGTKTGKALSPNTVRLARASLAGALKLAVERGFLRVNPMPSVPRPKPGRKPPRHWDPEQAKVFLRSQESHRLYPLWAFLLGCGLRIGELVWLRWDNVDLPGRRVRIVEFATSLGWGLVASTGKSDTAVRPVDLDDGLVRILGRQERHRGPPRRYRRRTGSRRRPAGRPAAVEERCRATPPGVDGHSGEEASGPHCYGPCRPPASRYDWRWGPIDNSSKRLMREASGRGAWRRRRDQHPGFNDRSPRRGLHIGIRPDAQAASGNPPRRQADSVMAP